MTTFPILTDRYGLLSLLEDEPWLSLGDVVFDTNMREARIYFRSRRRDSRRDTYLRVLGASSLLIERSGLERVCQLSEIELSASSVTIVAGLSLALRIELSDDSVLQFVVPQATDEERALTLDGPLRRDGLPPIMISLWSLLDLIHDAFFDLDLYVHDPERGEARIIVAEKYDRGGRWLLTFSDVANAVVRDSEQIGTYDINYLQFDPSKISVIGCLPIELAFTVGDECYVELLHNVAQSSDGWGDYVSKPPGAMAHKGTNGQDGLFAAVRRLLHLNSYY